MQTINLKNNTLSDAYDNIQCQIASADVLDNTALSGLVYFSLYGSPLLKAGSVYTGKADAVYTQFNGDGSTFENGIIEFVHVDFSALFWAFNTVQFNLEAVAVFDFSNAIFNGVLTLDNSDLIATIKVPVGTDVINNNSSYITVEYVDLVALDAIVAVFDTAKKYMELL